MEWPHLIDNALKAHHLYKRDVNYVVEHDDGDEIVIVDEFTGRVMIGRQWSDGLHQAVEAKEGVQIKEENADARDDHAAELLQALQEARGHDRHGHDRGERVLEDLQARRGRHPDQPAAAAGSTTPDVDLPHREGEVGRGRRRDRARSTRPGRPILVGTTVDREEREARRDMLQRARHQARGAQRQVPRARGRDRRPGRAG